MPLSRPPEPFQDPGVDGGGIVGAHAVDVRWTDDRGAPHVRGAVGEQVRIGIVPLRDNADGGIADASEGELPPAVVAIVVGVGLVLVAVVHATASGYGPVSNRPTSAASVQESRGFWWHA